MVSLDQELAEALKRDWRTADLDECDRAMLAYVEKLTKNPSSMWSDDREALHGPLGTKLPDRGQRTGSNPVHNFGSSAQPGESGMAGTARARASGVGRAKGGTRTSCGDFSVGRRPCARAP